MLFSYSAFPAVLLVVRASFIKIPAKDIGIVFQVIPVPESGNMSNIKSQIEQTLFALNPQELSPISTDHVAKQRTSYRPGIKFETHYQLLSPMYLKSLSDAASYRQVTSKLKASMEILLLTFYLEMSFNNHIKHISDTF